MSLPWLGRFDCATGLSRVLYADPLTAITVRTGVVSDVALIDKLQRENSYAVGFIQRTIWDRYVFGGERNFSVFVCEANNDPVGYVLITPGKGAYRYGKIQQIAVRDDARRLKYGSALLAVCREFCETFDRKGFTLRCRVDLDANNFWRQLGFRKYGVWEKGKVNHVGFKASDDINLWVIDLNVSLYSLFDDSDFMGADLAMYEESPWEAK
jgi:GNAT superfamily N-acetyltransferase